MVSKNKKNFVITNLCKEVFILENLPNISVLSWKIDLFFVKSLLSQKIHISFKPFNRVIYKVW